MTPTYHYLLWPLAAAYGIAVFVRNKLYDLKIFKTTSFKTPIIAIGNITVGGTGKTPHVAYLIKLLQTQTPCLAVLSRGYKRKSKGFRLVHTNSTVADAGDEPLLLKQQNPKILVAVDEKRVHGAQTLITQHAATTILLDDALQHRAIKPACNIVLIDYNRMPKYDTFLPVGQLRDNTLQLKRAQMIIITKTPPNLNLIQQKNCLKTLKNNLKIPVFFSTMVYGELTPVFESNNHTGPNLQNTAVIAVAAIAQPKPFLTHLKQRVAHLKPLLFKDHHTFTPNDLNHIVNNFQNLQQKHQDVIVITTAKDAVRLNALKNLIPPSIKQQIYLLPIEIAFLNNAQNTFNNHILQYVK